MTAPDPGLSAEDLRAMTPIGLAVSYASVALEYLGTEQGWPGFAAWLAANPDTAGMMLGRRQVKGAEILLSVLGAHLLGSSAEQISDGLGGASRTEQMMRRAVEAVYGMAREDGRGSPN